MLWVEEKRNKLWWSGKGDGVGSVAAMVKEELCEKVGKIRRMSDRVLAVVLAFEEDVLGLTCGYALHVNCQLNWF